MDLLRSVVYGVIEGITEWLPISSTGHMILAEQVLKFSLSAEFMEMFRVVIQLGAIMAVVVLYFKKLWPFCGDNGCDSGLAKHIRWPVLRLWLKIIVACLPAAVLGLLLDDWMDAHFYNSVVVAVMLIVYGIAFILIERRPRVARHHQIEPHHLQAGDHHRRMAGAGAHPRHVPQRRDHHWRPALAA